jgi:mono/diheme cytochrome c family protein
MPRRHVVSLAVAGATTLVALALAPAGRAQSVVFTEDYLRSPEKIALGRQVWVDRCQFCHGKTAYPGKAPRLEPKRYTPEFVFDRVTNGFRGMPPWKQEFSEEQRKAVVAYVLSREFSN